MTSYRFRVTYTRPEGGPRIEMVRRRGRTRESAFRKAVEYALHLPPGGWKIHSIEAWSDGEDI